MARKACQSTVACFSLRQKTETTYRWKYTTYFRMVIARKIGFVQAFEATFKNFSLHQDVKSLVVWSDNGPHYHNMSIILWLSHDSKLWNMNIERYTFFEAQKGKTSLDSHFATFKFALKAWMRRGKDVLESAHIIDGTKRNTCV